MVDVGVLPLRMHSVSKALLQGSAVALAVSVVAQGVGFALQVFLARVLGEVQFGYYSYAMAWLAVALIVGKLGYDTALVRFVAQYESQGQPGLLRAVVAHARRGTLVASLAVAVPGATLAWFAVPDNAALRATLIGAAVLLPFAVYSEITAAAVRGLRRVGFALAGDGVLRPLVTLALVALIVGAFGAASLSSSQAIGAYVVGTLASAALTGTVLRRFGPASTVEAHGAANATPGTWLATALPLMLASGFLALLYSVDTLMLGLLAGTTAAGHYAIASKIALLVLFAMNAAQAIAAPMLAGAHSAGRHGEFRSLVRQMNLIAAAISVPLAVVVMAFASPILGLLGDGFAAAAPCLQLLALMQVINSLTGPVGVVLTMSGRQRALVVLLAFGLAVNVLLNLWLIPRYGATGAALSALIAHTAWNLVGVAVIRKRMQVDCSFLSVLTLGRTAS